MHSDCAPYIRLLALAIEWAKESQAPPEMVLRNICDWAAAGAFPEEDLVDSTGERIAALDIYISCRCALNTAGSGVTLGGMTYYAGGDQWSHQVLSRTLIARESVIHFCKRTNTLPPPSMLSGFSRTWAKLKDNKCLAPPACPDAEQHASKRFARVNAPCTLASLESILTRLKEGHRRIGLQHAEEPIDFEFWGRRWQSARDIAHTEILRSGDPSLCEKLVRLEADWGAFVAEKSAGVLPEASHPLEPGTFEASSPVRRSRGRPAGSGSYRPLDAPLVEEMRAAISNDPSLSPTAAARGLVDRTSGGGTDDSKIKRLTERYLEKYGTFSEHEPAD
jgi:hypothetical protein